MARWQHAFFMELKQKAQQANCFIYNPNTVVVNGTNRLDVNEPALTHAGWGMNGSRVWLELYVGNRQKVETEAEENRQRFKKLFAEKTAIEQAFGEPLEWDYDEHRVKQTILSRANAEALADNRDDWPAIQDDLIARAIRLGAALKPFLAGVCR